MGFFGVGLQKKKKGVQGVSLELLHRAGCQVCPLNHSPGNKHPHMEPYGSDRPLVYMLGEAPGKDEDAKGGPFVGRAGEVLRFRIPDQWLPDLRWNNCVRTRPPQNRTPTMVEIECCRPSIEKDIEESKPEAIFGFGNVPLNWALRRSGISIWRGRRIPIKVGSHTCWFFPMIHPSAILHMAGQRGYDWDPRRFDDYVVDEEFAFALDLKRAFREVDEGLPEPKVWTQEDALEGIEFITGHDGKEDVDRVLSFIEDCYDHPEAGFDYETPCLRPYEKRARILTAALATERGALGFPLEHSGNGWTDSERKRVRDALEEFLYEYKGLKISHSLAFEMEWSAFEFGEKCLRAGKWADTMTQAFVLDGLRGRGDEALRGLSLDSICLNYFGFDLKAISNVDRAKLDETPVAEVCRYNALDAKFHREAWFPQNERLENEGLMEVYKDRVRHVPTAVLTQAQGVPVDQEEVGVFFDDYDRKRIVAENAILDDPDAKDFQRNFGGWKRKNDITLPFNPGASSKDVPKLFRWLGHPIPNADDAALAGIDHPLADLTREWRSAAKALSTYILPCVEGIEGSNIYPDGLLHYLLHLIKVRTLRSSSEGPNVQNWPKRDETLKEIRRIIQARRKETAELMRKLGTDLYVVSFDYAGIQARNIAMESLDQALIEAFWNRYDVHKTWMERTREIFPEWEDEGKDPFDDANLKHFRHLSKNRFVFPSFFGASPNSVGPSLGVPIPIAEQLNEELFRQFPKVKKWQERTRTNYKRDGYVTGLSKIRRFAPVSWNELINSPIQADEVTIVLDAMSTLSEMGKPQFQAMLEIHDDLTFLWPRKDIERNAEVVIDVMTDVPYEWAKVVPIEVEMSVGPNWADMEDIGAYSSDKWNGELPDEHIKKLFEKFPPR